MGWGGVGGGGRRKLNVAKKEKQNQIYSPTLPIYFLFIYLPIYPPTYLWSICLSIYLSV